MISINNYYLTQASLSAQEAQNVAAEAAAHASITHSGYHDATSLGSHIGAQIVSPNSPRSSSSSSASFGETELASNHNYGEFKPSNQYSFAGY
jgi:hypothetical protein